MPGKTPASAAPRKKRRAVTPAAFVVPPIPAQNVPKATTRKASHLTIWKIGLANAAWTEWMCRKQWFKPHLLGENTFSARLLGASKTEYATRNNMRATVN